MWAEPPKRLRPFSYSAKYRMRKLIDLITEASIDEDYQTARQRAGFAPAPSKMMHLRIYRQMQKLANSNPTTEEAATTLLQDIEYLKDAMKEFGARQGGEVEQTMTDVLNHLMMFLPKDGDIEGVLHSPHETMREIIDGMKFLHKQLAHEGILVESFYEKRHELKQGDCFRDRDGDIVMLDERVEGDGTKWTVALWWGSSWAYEGSTVEPSDLVERVPNPETK